MLRSVPPVPGGTCRDPTRLCPRGTDPPSHAGSGRSLQRLLTVAVPTRDLGPTGRSAPRSLVGTAPTPLRSTPCARRWGATFLDDLVVRIVVRTAAVRCLWRHKSHRLPPYSAW